MGLKERRAIKEFQDSIYPELKKQMDTAAGFDVDLEVQWDTLAIPEMAHLYGEHWPKVYFEPVINGFKEICIDDMGKEALKSGLHKIMFCNIQGTSSGKSSVTFKDGILTVDHQPHTNVDDVSERTEAVIDIISDNI